MSVVVDASINLRGHTSLGFYDSKDRADARVRGGTAWTTEGLIQALDDAGIDKAAVLASVAANGVGGAIDQIHAEEVHEVVSGAPDRLFGMIGINPLTTMETLRNIQFAVTELGFKGVHVYPHWFGERVDDKTYWPIYAKCVELDVPIAMQVGRQTPRSGAKLAAKPSWLDSVAFAFPELKLLGLHIGTPWLDEMIMMCRNWDNIYIVADARPPGIWEQNLVDFIAGSDDYRFPEDSADKVIWGSDWPVQEFKPTVEAVRALGLPPKSEENLLGLNACRVFGL